MAAPLEDHFDAAVVRRIGAMLRSAHPAFPESRFVAEASKGLGGLELIDRARHVAAAMRRALPADFDAAAKVIVASLGPPLDRTDGFGMAVFLYLPHVIFVAQNGLDHLETSMAAQHALTRRFTAEFSIRAFLERDPERTLARLREWACDQVCARWSRGAGPERRALIRHALRWLVKKGDRRALRVLGFGGGRGIRVTGRIRRKRVRVGESCAIFLSVENRGRAPQALVVDLAVFFVKADGRARAKVFRVRSLRLAPGEKASLDKAVSFAQRTTRRHHPGRHRLEALVNVRAVPLGHVDVVDG